MTTTERRYDIDWLRVIAIGLLLVYHIGIGFQPWGVFIGFIQNDKPLDALWIPMTMINIWRIPLLFFVSGMGVGFSMRKRNWKQLLRERTGRILVPFLFGSLLIVPVHSLIWQNYYHQDMTYTPGPGHLWFLANIFIYVILLLPVFIYLKKNLTGRVARVLKKIYSHPLGILVIPVPFILEAAIVRPETYELYALTLHGFLLGFLAFFFGFTFVLTGNAFWHTAVRWRWLFLSAGLIFYGIRLSVFHLKAPGYLMAMESCAWIFGIFGFANKFLDRKSRMLSYLSEAAYPVYIIHMIFLYLASLFIFPLDIPAAVKFILTVIFTGTGCFITYDLAIRRIRFLRPLFGLKYNTYSRININPVKSTIMIILLLAYIKYQNQSAYSQERRKGFYNNSFNYTGNEFCRDPGIVTK